MTDTADNKAIAATISDPTFQRRVRLRFINSAIAVAAESTGVTSHANRLALAGAIFNSTINIEMLCMCVLCNSTIRTALLSAPTPEGGAIADSDIDFQVNSVFTGIAISRAW